MCYPLFTWFKGSGRKVLSWIMKTSAVPGLMIVWFSIPLLLMKALIPPPVLSVGSGGWGFLYYIWFLISGFIIVSSDRLQAQIKNQRWISLLLGAALSTVYLFQLFSPSRVILPAGMGDWIYALFSILSAWCWLFAILGLGMRHLSFDRPFLRYANEGVLPFFILHQTVLLGIGYFVMTWEIPDILKWAVVFTGSFIVIISLYAFIIRKYALFRFLFGMKTTHPFFHNFRKWQVFILLHVLYVGLIVFAVFNQISAGQSSLSPMPMTYDPLTDIILNGDMITDQSPTGVRMIDDEDASIGKAIEFVSGAVERPEPQPEFYIDMSFSAPAGQYFVWLRGKSDKNNNYTDSVWLQTDDQIGTSKGNMMGNWMDIHPVGVYGWAGERHHPICIHLKRDGEHRIRIQPRQTPHRIDQIWLSRSQSRIPDKAVPIQDQ
jgi:hypothetical protein